MLSLFQGPPQRQRNDRLGISRKTVEVPHVFFKVRLCTRRDTSDALYKLLSWNHAKIVLKMQIPERENTSTPVTVLMIKIRSGRVQSNWVMCFLVQNLNPHKKWLCNSCMDEQLESSYPHLYNNETTYICMQWYPDERKDSGLRLSRKAYSPTPHPPYFTSSLRVRPFGPGHLFTVKSNKTDEPDQISNTEN